VKSPKTYVILLLAATTVGGAILAWRQHGELSELRSAAMNRGERSDLQRRLWDLEKLNRDLQAQLSRRGPGDSDESGTGNADGDRPPRDRGGRGGERGPDPRARAENALQQANAIRDLMNKPEVQAMINLQQRAAIEGRYATLFKNLNLSPEQTEKLKSLLAERSTTMQDVMAASREQGINPRENPDVFRKLVADAQDVVNNGIKSVIGEQGFQQLTTYEQTLPQRNLVNELQQRLSYTSTPLTAAQAEQMVQILAANPPQRNISATSASGPNPEPMRGPPPGGRGGPPPVDFAFRGSDLGGVIAGVLGGGPGMGPIDGGRGGGSIPVTSGAVTQSQTVLSPPQVTALQQIQQQQQAQQQLRQMVNDTLGASHPAGSKSAPPPRPRGG
jgi:chorismate mutase